MRRFLFVFLFLPQLVLAQYNAKCFRLDATADTKQVIVRQTITEDAEIPFGVRTPISGLSVSGRVVFENDDDSYVRVIMKDDYNYEHLVYENYPLLADGMSVDFQNIAIETKRLDGITPSCIRVELKNATLVLESLSYVGTSGTKAQAFENETVLKKEQSQYIVDRLNENLAKHDKTWRAGMTSVAEKTFEEKKAMFGGKLPQLYGFEYYAGGIFVMPGALKSAERVKIRSVTSSPYVSEWDWRNRHGKNWMTCVKNQGGCGSCWAHAAVGAVEAYVNLYYNRLIDPNLSEMETMACTNNACRGSYENVALKYIRDHGIVGELCFPYILRDSDNCDKKCKNPDTLIYINNYRFINKDADSIKQALLNNPLTITIGPWDHGMIIVGYKVIDYGDTIYLGNQSGAHYVTIDDNHLNYLNKNAWLLKNSWGETWGSNGYCYIFVNESNIWRVLTPTGNVTCSILGNNIICEDADGDGYYYWGLGPKPANSPSWVHDTPDGDDSNSQLGPMNQFGYLTDLSNLSSQSIISGNTTYNTNMTMSNNTVVIADAKLTITGVVNMASGVKLTVHYNGTIVVDGGTLQNADLLLHSGCHVIVKNGGSIIMQSGKQFDAPLGATVDVLNGNIQ